MMQRPRQPPGTITVVSSAIADAAPPVPITAGWQLDVAGQRLVGPAGEIELPALEFRLLEIFTRHPHQVLSRDELLDLAWGPEFDGTDHAVDRAVCRLRHLLNPDQSKPRALRTRRGAGYCFYPPPAP